MRAHLAKSETPEPADAAAALYVGKVMHARLKPMGHRFSYRVMSLSDRSRPAGGGGPAIAAVRRQPGGAL